MSKWEKLIARIRNNPKAVSFEEVAKVLESIGYEKRQPRSGSSHWTFRKKRVSAAYDSEERAVCERSLCAAGHPSFG